MSKFRSFASQGSFRDYQIKAPDETNKIKEETARTIRGMDRAESFRREISDINFRAQKLVQQQEEDFRKLNKSMMDLEREGYKQALERDYKIQEQNAQARDAEQTELINSISQFSKTAFQLGVQIKQNADKKSTIKNAQLAGMAGLTSAEAIEIQKLDDNLTKSELAQISWVKEKVANGTDMEVIWELFGRRNTAGFIQNKSTIQNNAYGIAPQLNKFVEKSLEEGRDLEDIIKLLPAEQARLVAETMVDANGNPFNAKVVESIGKPIYGAGVNKLKGDLERQLKENRKTELDQATYRAMDTFTSPEEFINWSNNNKGRANVTTLANYFTRAAQREGPGSRSAQFIQSVFEGTFDGTKEVEMSIAKRWGLNSVEGFAFQEAINTANDTVKARNVRIKQEETDRVSREVVGGLEAILSESGTIPDSVMEDARTQLTIAGVNDNILDRFEPFNTDVQTSKLLSARWTTEFERTGIPPELEQITKTPLSFEDRAEWLQKRAEYDKVDIPKKMFTDRIRATVENRKSSFEIANTYTQIRADMEVAKFMAAVKDVQDLDYITNLANQTTTRIDLENQNVENFDEKGRYLPTVRAVESSTAQAQIDTKERIAVIDEIKKQPKTRRDFKALSNALGAQTVLDNLDALASGQPTDANFNFTARSLKLSPLQLGEILDKTSSLGIVTETSGMSEWEAVKQVVQSESQAAANKRNGEAGRFPAVIERLNYANPGMSRGNLPVRESLSQLNSGVQITDPRDGNSGVDFVVQNGIRGAGYYFPLEGKVLKVVTGRDTEFRLEEGATQRSFGNYVEVQVKIPELGNRVVDMLFAHFDQISELKPGDLITPGTLLGTQGRSGSTTGAHVSFDCYVPGTALADSTCRDWFRDNHIK